MFDIIFDSQRILVAPSSTQQENFAQRSQHLADFVQDLGRVGISPKMVEL